VKDERVKRLLTMPQIGPVTAVSFVATLDEVGRFRGAHQVEAYLGLVPREWSSSEVQRRGILYAMWRDGSVYETAKLGHTQGASANKAA
jgi:transposase